MDSDGAVIGNRYRLVRELGSGGMADVWLAADERLDGKLVAVKRLRTPGPPTPEDLERARREAFAASRLAHPNLVAVTDFLVETGAPVIVMEYVAGRTLEQLIEQDGPLDLAGFGRILGQVAGALAEAHTAGIVHRDIKPANVIVSERGDAKLADFGIARSEGDARFTRTGAFTGTVAYLAPELLDGSEATPASDVWSLGAMAFEMAQGGPAFGGPTTPAVLAAIAMGPLPRVTRLPVTADLVAAMLDREPARRPAAAQVAATAPQLPARPVATNPLTKSRAAAADGPPPGATVVSASAGFGPPAPSPNRPSGPRPRRKTRGRVWLVAAIPAGLAVVVGVGFAVTSGGSGHGPLAEGNTPPGTVHSSTRAPSSAPANNGLSGGGEPTTSPPLVGGEPPAAPVFAGTFRVSSRVSHESGRLPSAAPPLAGGGRATVRRAGSGHAVLSTGGRDLRLNWTGAAWVGRDSAHLACAGTHDRSAYVVRLTPRSESDRPQVYRGSVVLDSTASCAGTYLAAVTLTRAG